MLLFTAENENSRQKTSVYNPLISLLKKALSVLFYKNTIICIKFHLQLLHEMRFLSLQCRVPHT